jgi:predicted AlkP superfamily pyrophosphatase or phosphodiesterase
MGSTNVYKQSFEREVLTLLANFYSSGNLEVEILHLQSLNELSLNHQMVHELLIQAASFITDTREKSQVKLLIAFVLQNLVTMEHIKNLFLPSIRVFVHISVLIFHFCRNVFSQLINLNI